MARCGRVGAGQHGAARTLPHQGGARPDAERSRHRLPGGQDHRKRGVRGYDGGKRIKGRKRHILVDVEGFLLAARVEPADISDSAAAVSLLTSVAGRFPRLTIIWADASYQGRVLDEVASKYLHAHMLAET